MDHFKWHYLPTVRNTFHKSWESTWKKKHLLFLPYIVFASSTMCSWDGAESSVCIFFFPNNQSFLSYNYRKIQNKLDSMNFQLTFVQLQRHTEPQFSGVGVKPTISYTLPILQGILCLIMQQEVSWEEELKYRQKTFQFLRLEVQCYFMGIFAS